MKTMTVGMLLASVFAAGCATPEPAQPPRAGWDVSPVFAVEHGMQRARGFYELGRLYQQRGQLQKAERAFVEAIAADSGHLDAYNALAAVYATRGQLDRAVAMLEKAVEAAPTTAYLHSNLGYALWLAGRDDDAARNLRRAVELDAGNRRAWANLAKVYRRLGDHGNETFASVRAGAGSSATHAAAAVGAGVHVSPVAPAPAFVSLVEPPGTAVASPEPGTRQAAAVTTRLVQVASNVYDLRAEEAPTAPAPSVRAESLVVAAAGKPAAGRDVRYEVANGNGRKGVARRVGDLMMRDGYPTPHLSDERPFTQQVTVVHYRPGRREAAAEIAARLPFRPAVRESASPGLASDVRVVLGRDLFDGPGCATLDLCSRIAADDPSPPTDNRS